MAFDPSEWEVVKPAKPTFNPDEWEVVSDASPPESTFGKDLAANFTAAANAMNPFADEGAAALRSVLPGFQSYDEELAAIRGGEAAHSEAHPYQSGASSVIGALASAPFIPTSIAKGAPTGINALRAFAEGIGLGGVYGFGNSEGGFDQRLEDAGEAAALSGATGGALPYVAAGVKNIGHQFLKHALNVQRSDAAKAAKFLPKGSPKKPLDEALKAANERGMFGVFDDPANLVIKNEGEIDRLGGEVSGILSAADSAQTNVVLPTGHPIAKEFIDAHPYEEEALMKQLAGRLDTHNQKWDGTISGYNDLKRKLYKLGYRNTTDNAGLDKALGADMREFIEAQADGLLGPEEVARMKELNRAQGEHLTLRDLLEKEKNRDQMAGGIPKALRRLTVSPLGGAAAGAGLSMATGNPIPLAVATAGSLLGTRQGQMMLSKGSGLASRAPEFGGVAALSQLSSYLAGRGSSPTDVRAPGLPDGTVQAGDLSGTPSPQSSTGGMQSGKAVQLLSELSSSLQSATPRPVNQGPSAQFDRSTESILANPDAFLQKAAELSGGNQQLMADIQGALSEPNPMKRDMALASLAQSIPQLFPPSPWKSLWGGRLNDPQEQAMYADDLKTKHRLGQIDANYLAKSMSAINADGSVLPPPPIQQAQPQQVRLPTPQGQPQQYSY